MLLNSLHSAGTSLSSSLAPQFLNMPPMHHHHLHHPAGLSTGVPPQSSLTSTMIAGSGTSSFSPFTSTTGTFNNSNTSGQFGVTNAYFTGTPYSSYDANFDLSGASSSSSTTDDQLAFNFASQLHVSSLSKPINQSNEQLGATNSKPSNLDILLGLKTVNTSGSAGCASSQNVIEKVLVPSSEHVAEIVGRQGCKIKKLRGETNTYIKTPVRGEPPMFVITGRKEDVHRAKREIMLAADHFSQIRARRGGSVETTSATSTNMTNTLAYSGSSSSSSKSISPNNHQVVTNNSRTTMHHGLLTDTVAVDSSSCSSSISSSPPHTSGTVTALEHLTKSPKASPPPPCASSPSITPTNVPPTQQVKKVTVTVPYQVVGLVVGPRGSTIKRIQQATSTYIVTPSRDSQPIFEIQGAPDNVEAARCEIENYIRQRTATSSSSSSSSCGDNNNNNTHPFLTPSSLGLLSDTGLVPYDDFYSNGIDIEHHPEHETSQENDGVKDKVVAKSPSSPVHVHLHKPTTTSPLPLGGLLSDKSAPASSIWSAGVTPSADNFFLVAGSLSVSPSSSNANFSFLTSPGAVEGGACAPDGSEYEFCASTVNYRRHLSGTSSGDPFLSSTAANITLADVALSTSSGSSSSTDDFHHHQLHHQLNDTSPSSVVDNDLHNDFNFLL